MSFGHGILDYLVVAGVFCVTFFFLWSDPRKLLLWLPLFLTIDFFIPLGTQLTPSRFVPAMLGVWLLFVGFPRLNFHQLFAVAVAFLLIALATFYSLDQGDTGLRPIFRAAHYASLIFVFLFTIRIARTRPLVELILWGLVLAGTVHGIYAIYQLFASTFGLPFRGVVYSAGGGSGHSQLGSMIRVNGFADEPKRLGYVLFSAALSIFFLVTNRERNNRNDLLAHIRAFFISRTYLVSIAVACLGASLLTYSGSYFLAVAIFAAIMVVTFSGRAILSLGVALLSGLLLAVAAPQLTEAYSERAADLLDQRLTEVEEGLGAQKVYRQEFFAEEIISRDPWILLTGVGMGRYNQVFFRTFGTGAGLGFRGDIMPLNAQPYEVVLDLGVIGFLLLFGSALAIAITVGRKSSIGSALSALIIFLSVQSLFIDAKFYLVLLMAAGTCWMRCQRMSQANPKRLQPIRKRNTSMSKGKKRLRIERN